MPDLEAMATGAHIHGMAGKTAQTVLLNDYRTDIDAAPIRIAVGRGKGLGRIENVRWSVKNLIKKLSVPAVDTSISFAQYQALQKKSKAGEKAATDLLLEKKRAPGNWTAARYTGTSRKAPDVAGKSAVVLDIDNVSQDQLGDIRSGVAATSQFAWFMHTSRSHCPEKPKVRLIVWVNRMMTPDESHAVHRLLSLYLAEDPDEAIEIPDLVSFRTNQTMFWPSISQGQEFWTDENIAPILDVDEFLAGHPEWDNHENLPYQEGERKRGKLDPNRKMADPRKKANPIGAFCRAYTVEDVIEKWLDDIYSPGDSQTETRYNYVPGSASNGAVVYDNGLFLHSNHGTDPIEGSANAFDLLRVHKFGHLDTDAHANTSPGSMPSYKAMAKLSQNDPIVAAEEYGHMGDMLDDLEDDDEEGDPDANDLLGDDSDPGDLIGEPVPESRQVRRAEERKKKKAEAGMSWMAYLARRANGDIEGVVHNAVLLFDEDRRFEGCAGFNDHTGEVVALKQIKSTNPQVRTTPVPASHRNYRRWEDGDDIAVRRIASAPLDQGGYGVDFTRQNIEEAVYTVARRNAFHPVKEKFLAAHEKYVESGRKTRGSIEQLPQTYLGCPDDEFHRQSSKFFLIAMVARTFEPGCKFDCVPIIRGNQGGRKGEFWRTVSYGYFANLPSNFENVGKMVEAMKGNVICELGEMAGLRRETAEIAKDFITKQEDQLRLAYARREGVYPRQNILVGTSNLDDILHDPTGNRRFWIWADSHSEDDPIDIEGMREMQDYLVGEAVDEYLCLREQQPRGSLWLDLRTKEAREGRDAVAERFRKRTATEDIADLISTWMDATHPASEVMVDKDGLVLDEFADDETPMIRNMFTGSIAHKELRHASEVSTLKNAGPPTYGAALRRIGSLHDLGRCRRHTANMNWFYRFGDGPLWVPARGVGPSDDSDDLI
jgi:Ruegeria phage DNA helicase